MKRQMVEVLSEHPPFRTPLNLIKYEIEQMTRAQLLEMCRKNGVLEYEKKTRKRLIKLCFPDMFHSRRRKRVKDAGSEPTGWRVLAPFDRHSTLYLPTNEKLRDVFLTEFREAFMVGEGPAFDFTKLKEYLSKVSLRPSIYWGGDEVLETAWLVFLTQVYSSHTCIVPDNVMITYLELDSLRHDYTVENIREAKAFIEKSCGGTEVAVVQLVLREIEEGDEDSNEVHANVLVFDKIAKKVLLFEPHGTDKDLTRYGVINRLVLEHFQPFTLSPLPCWFTGPQEKSESPSKGGFCSAWGKLFVHLMLANPGQSATVMMDALVKSLNSYGLLQLIREYVSLMFNMAPPTVSRQSLYINI